MTLLHVEGRKAQYLVGHGEQVDDIIDVSGQGQLGGLEEVVSDRLLEHLVPLAVQHGHRVRALYQGVFDPQDQAFRQNVQTELLEKSMREWNNWIKSSILLETIPTKLKTCDGSHQQNNTSHCCN